MKKIYLAHSTGFDYKVEVYQPIRNSELNKKYHVVLPHEENPIYFDSKSVITNVDLVLAEVSHPSTGQGIELGWADKSGIPIICFYKSGQKISSALQMISAHFLIYKNKEEMIGKLSEYLDDYFSRKK